MTHFPPFPQTSTQDAGKCCLNVTNCIGCNYLCSYTYSWPASALLSLTPKPNIIVTNSSLIKGCPSVSCIPNIATTQHRNHCPTRSGLSLLKKRFLPSTVSINLPVRLMLLLRKSWVSPTSSVVVNLVSVNAKKLLGFSR